MTYVDCVFKATFPVTVPVNVTSRKNTLEMFCILNGIVTEVVGSCGVCGAYVYMYKGVVVFGTYESFAKEPTRSWEGVCPTGFKHTSISYIPD